MEFNISYSFSNSDFSIGTIILPSINSPCIGILRVYFENLISNTLYNKSYNSLAQICLNSNQQVQH